jgi:hypothetical protein
MANRSRKPQIQFRATIDPAQWQEAVARLWSVKGGAYRAAVAAINKTLPGVRTDAVRAVTSAYTVKPREARQSMSVSKASVNNLQGVVTSRGSTIPLGAFQVKPMRVSGVRPKGGLTVAVKRGGGGSIGSAFVVNNLNVGGGYGRMTGPAIRIGGPRLPIRPLYGPSVPAMLTQEEQLGPLQDAASGRLYKAMEHEIKRLAAGYGK